MNAELNRQRALSVASLQQYEQARIKAAPKVQKPVAHSAPVETPAEIAQKAELKAEAAVSVAALHRLQAAQAQEHETK